MKRWRVDLRRDVETSATIFVEADTKEDAEYFGMKRVKSYEFYEDESHMEVVFCEEVDNEGEPIQ